jgi:hypothetical protein
MALQPFNDLGKFSDAHRAWVDFMDRTRVCFSCSLEHPDGMGCEDAKAEYLRLIQAALQVRRARKAATMDRWRKRKAGRDV